MTLTEFLYARIAEDEAAARAVINDPFGHCDSEGRWRFIGYDYADFWPDAGDDRYIGAGWFETEESWVVHATRQSPARVVTECQAKRQVLSALPERAEHLRPHEVVILAALALPYQDHPDYDWRWAS